MRRLPALIALLGITLGGCARYDYTGSLNIPVATGILSTPGETLAKLPPPSGKPVNIAVYDFQDLTGQNKSSVNTGFAEFSRAITQGASAIVVDALKTAGGGTWFNISERSYLDSLLRERRLIQETFQVLKRDPRGLIDPLSFAEYLITGGVISYDSPISSAGVTGGYAGYTGGVTGRQDLVTINLRLVRVRDGVVVQSINASRPIITASASVNVARILGTSIVEAQGNAGLSEATQTAVREAIETAVYEMIRQNVAAGIWQSRPDPIDRPSVRLSGGHIVPPPRPVRPPISVQTDVAPEPAVVGTLPPLSPDRKITEADALVPVPAIMPANER